MLVCQEKELIDIYANLESDQLVKIFNRYKGVTTRTSDLICKQLKSVFMTKHEKARLKTLNKFYDLYLEDLNLYDAAVLMRKERNILNNWR